MKRVLRVIDRKGGESRARLLAWFGWYDLEAARYLEEE